MSKFIQSVKQLIARILGQSSNTEDQKVELVKGLMGALELTQEVELGCDEVFEVIDKYAEAVVQGVDTRELMPLVYHHIEMCGECREELEMLLEMIELEAA
ncbi:MAG: hypothetical protein QNJ45_10720 [Ardenticatenaceae bacterium]|nr:hypothetical protein [Ardenticatenaceae bacterium]